MKPVFDHVDKAGFCWENNICNFYCVISFFINFNMIGFSQWISQKREKFIMQVINNYFAYTDSKN